MFSLKVYAKAEISYDTDIDNVCISDTICINADTIKYAGKSYTSNTFCNSVSKEDSIGRRDNFILQNYFIKSSVNEEKYVHTTNQEKIDNTTFSDTHVDMENVKFLNADIGAIDDISISGEDITSQDIILYSAKGNITIDNSSNINFRGLIYAPNGTITLKTNNLNIDGTILAKNINLVSDVVNINNQSTLSNYILSQPKLEDTQIGDYTFEYDTFGTTENITCDGNTYLKYSYTGDLSHKLSKIVYINGDSQEYFYNSDGLLIGYSTNGKSSSDMKYEYDSDNKLTQKLDYENNLKTCYSDSAYTVYKMDTNKDVYLYEGKINAVKFLPEPVQPDVLVDGTNLTYTYNCNLKEEKEQYSLKNSGDIVYIQKDGKNISYTYDQQRQLTRVDDEHLGLRYVYQYDEIGNLINKKTYELGTKQAANLLEQKTYDYDNEYPDRMIQFDDNTIKYDGLGNPTQYGNWTMQWEQGRKLVELSSSTGDTIRYKYDDNNRVAKIVNGTETNYQYVGGKVYKQWDKNATITFDMDSKCDYLGFTLNGQKYNYVKNLLGDVIAIEDKNGQNICSYEYDPWGKCIITGDKEVGAINSTISWSSQFSCYLSNEYNKCMKYLDNRDGSSSTYESLLATSLKVGYRIVSDITKGCRFFYSPRSMANGATPSWVKPSAEVKISGIDRSHFRFYTETY